MSDTVLLSKWRQEYSYSSKKPANIREVSVVSENLHRGLLNACFIRTCDGLH